MSHHNPRLLNLKIPSNYFHKTDFKEIVKDGVIFQDGSYEKIDIIVYCTGMRIFKRIDFIPCYLFVFVFRIHL